MNPSGKKGTVLYLYDPLCGWCYGFSPVIVQLYEKHKNNCQFEVLSGGMIIGRSAGEVGKVAPYISWAYKEVEKRTQIVFGDAFLQMLKKGTARFNSLPGAIAMAAFRAVNPQLSIHYAAAIQKGVYYDGLEPESDELYVSTAAKLGVDPVQFSLLIHEQRFGREALADFEKVAAMKISGYPTVLYRHGEETTLIASGYQPFAEVDARLQVAMSAY